MLALPHVSGSECIDLLERLGFRVHHRSTTLATLRRGTCLVAVPASATLSSPLVGAILRAAEIDPLVFLSLFEGEAKNNQGEGRAREPRDSGAGGARARSSTSATRRLAVVKLELSSKSVSAENATKAEPSSHVGSSTPHTPCTRVTETHRDRAQANQPPRAPRALRPVPRADRLNKSAATLTERGEQYVTGAPESERSLASRT